MERLAIISLMALVVVTSGCAALQGNGEPEPGVLPNETNDTNDTDVLGEPDPVVQSVNVDQGPIENIIGEEGEVTVDVANQGEEGQVEVRMIIYDDQGNALVERERTVSMDADGTREVDFSLSIPQGAAEVDAQVQPAQ